MPISTGDGFHEYVMMVFIMYQLYNITNDPSFHIMEYVFIL